MREPRRRLFRSQYVVAALVTTRALSLLAALGSIALSGCATIVQDDWHAAPSFPPLRPCHVEVANSDLARLCGDQPGMRLYGCAIRDVSSSVCLIYTGPAPAAWLMEHERKHCTGWDHGPTHPRTHVAALS